MEQSVAKRIIQSAANRTVSQTKSAGVIDHVKSNPKTKNLPGLSTMKLKRKETLEAALENLMYPEEIDSAYPAPIATSNLYVSSASTSGDVLNLPNGNGNVPHFNSYLLQQGDPQSPVLYSSGTTYPYQADGGATSGSVLAVERDGPQWGTLFNDRVGLYLMSEFKEIGSLKGQIWEVETTVANATVTLNDRSDHIITGMFESTVYSTAGTVIDSDASDVTGQIIMTIPVAGRYYIEITYASLAGESRRQLSVVVTQGGGAACESPQVPNVLRSLPYSNFKYIAARSDRVRLNSAGLLLTCVMPELYEGGSIQAGKIISSIAPESDYSSYLYTLKKKYLGKLKEGAYGMWFPNGPQWNLAPLSNRNYSNSFESSDIVNLFILDYTHPTGANVAQIDVQAKIDGWVDYTTNDTTVPQLPGIVFMDEWLTAVSALEALFVFSDNPNHNKIKEVIKKASDFVRSGHPVAQALRSAGSMAVKALPPLLMAAGLL